jgi:hypothetical protein
MYQPSMRKTERATEDTETAMATLDLSERGSDEEVTIGTLLEVAELVKMELIVEEGMRVEIEAVEVGRGLLVAIIGREIVVFAGVPALTVTTGDLTPNTFEQAPCTFPTAMTRSTWLQPSFKHPIAFPVMFPVPQWQAKSVSFAHPSVKTVFTMHVNAHVGSWRD